MLNYYPAFYIAYQYKVFYIKFIYIIDKTNIYIFYIYFLKKKYLQQQVITNPYFKQRPNINKIIEKTKTTLILIIINQKRNFKNLQLLMSGEIFIK